MKLTPGLLLITRKYLKRKLNLSYFDDDTFIDGCDPNVEIIPFLNYLEIYDEKRFKIFKNLNSEEVLQKILYLFITKKDQENHEDFRWMTSSYRGIEFIKNVLDDNMNACLRQANLYNDESIYMERWWDELYKYSRMKTDENFAQIGRLGENYSYLYELNRVGKKPKKEYILNTSAGYDLLSEISHNSAEKLMIEIKSSTKKIDLAEASISKTQFLMATKHENFIFHFWLLKDHKLAVLDANTVISTAPSNLNEGRWQEFKVPFAVFKDEFKNVNIEELKN